MTLLITNHQFYLILLIISFLALVIIVYFVIKGRKELLSSDQESKYYNEPFIYKIDGKQMNDDEAKDYYYSQLARNRRKNTLHLVVLDCLNDKIIYDDLASKYFEKC